MEYLKKVQTPQMVKVVIKKIFDEKEHEQYGNSTNCVIIYNDVEYYESFKPKNYHLLKEGKELIGTRKLYDGKPYFEWNENVLDGHQAIDQPVSNEAKVEVQQEDKPDWDKIAEGKTRCAVVCAIIEAGKVDEWRQYMEDIDRMVEYIFTGK